MCRGMKGEIYEKGPDVSCIVAHPPDLDSMKAHEIPRYILIPVVRAYGSTSNNYGSCARYKCIKSATYFYGLLYQY